MVPLSVQGGGGRLRPCFPVSSFPSSRNPSPPFPNLEARLKLEIPAACPKLSEEHLGKCTDPPTTAGVYPAPLFCTHTGSPTSLPSTAPVLWAPRDAPKPSSSSHLQVPHTPLWQAKAAAGERLESQPALQTSPCSRTTCSKPTLQIFQHQVSSCKIQCRAWALF